MYFTRLEVKAVILHPTLQPKTQNIRSDNCFYDFSPIWMFANTLCSVHSQGAPSITIWHRYDPYIALELELSREETAERGANQEVLEVQSLPRFNWTSTPFSTVNILLHTLHTLMAQGFMQAAACSSATQCTSCAPYYIVTLLNN